MKDYARGPIAKDFLKSQVNNFYQPFYVNGPLQMMGAVQSQLADPGVGDNAIVVEI